MNTILKQSTPGAIQTLSPQAASQVRGGIASTDYPSDSVAQRHSEAKGIASPTAIAIPGEGRGSGRDSSGGDGHSTDSWSEAIHSVLAQPPAALSRHLILLGVAFTGVLGTWAWTGQMQEVSHAQGELIPLGRTFKIQPAIAGKIDSILVKEGDAVAKGQLLFSIESDLMTGELERLQETLTAEQQKLAQVRLLVNSAQREGLAQAQQAAATIQAQQAVQSQSRADVQTHELLLAALQGSLTAHEERFVRIGTLEEKGAISREYLFEIEQGVRRQAQEITQASGNLARSQALIEQTNAEMTQKRSQAQQISVANEETLQKLKMEAQGIEATMADTALQIKQAQTRLEQSEVRSPANGVLSSLAIDNSGEFVQSGAALAEVVPAGTPLVLSALVPQREAGLITTGMTTQIKFDAFPYQNYGVMSGTVVSISPDTKGSPETGGGYEVSISLKEDHVMHEQSPVLLQVGQTASAEIIVRKRKVIDLFLDPIRRLQADELSL